MSPTPSRPCPSMKDLPPEALDQVAAYFQVLSEPMRLRLLNLLREREYNVGELAQAWLLAHPEVSSVITGATRADQVLQNVKAADWALSPGDVEEVNKILRGEG